MNKNSTILRFFNLLRKDVNKFEADIEYAEN